MDFFSSLPTEMIEEVAEYLSVEDLIACSMVNKQWRSVFDNDRIWKRFSTFHKNYFDKQVFTQSNFLKYCFEGCESKKKVFQELQVGKNLREGKYDIVRVDIGNLYCDNLLDLVDDVGNHWLFVSCAKADTFEVNCHMIEVWNMNDKPKKHQSVETLLNINTRLLDSQMRAFKNKLYYMVDNYVLAFEFSHPEYTLTLLFQVSCPCLVETSYTVMVCKPNKVFGFVYSHLHFYLSENPWVHVWRQNSSLRYMNYSSSTLDEMEVRINNLVPEVPGVLIQQQQQTLKVQDGGNSDNILLVYKTITGLVVVLFCTKSYQYTCLFDDIRFIRDVSYCDYVNNVVVLLYHIKKDLVGIMRFDPELICLSIDGGVCHELQLRSRGEFLPSSVLLVKEERKTFVLCSQGREVTVYDVLERREIYRFQVTCSDVIGPVIKKNLMLFAYEKNNKITYEVWDFKHGKRLYGFDKLQSLSGRSAFYRFAFNKCYRFPPKIFGIKEPNIYYARPENGEIAMISFL